MGNVRSTNTVSGKETNGEEIGVDEVQTGDWLRLYYLHNHDDMTKHRRYGSVTEVGTERRGVFTSRKGSSDRPVDFYGKDPDAGSEYEAYYFVLEPTQEKYSAVKVHTRPDEPPIVRSHSINRYIGEMILFERVSSGDG